MLYTAYELSHAAVRPYRNIATATRQFLQSTQNPYAEWPANRALAAACEVFESVTKRYGKPAFDINEVVIGKNVVPINEKFVMDHPFGRLLHFERDAAALPSNQKNAPKIYQTSHVYVMLKYKDPCPNTVIEAMSCGMPILFSMSGGIPELVDKKCGLGLKVKDSWKEKKIVPGYNDIANGMIEIYKNYEFMSKNARQRAVERFDIKHWISRHEKTFKKYLTKCKK